VLKGGKKMQSKLLVLRKENGYTQEDIAKQLHITAKTYSLKERGEAAFDSDEMFLISNFFGKSISDIFYLEVTKMVTKLERRRNKKSPQGD
jgi:Predicted transcriptional regulators